MAGVFRRCSSCKKDIALGAKYWVCSVSTCNRGRTALYFCTTDCWDAHLGIVPHRESWAEEQRSPSREEWAAHAAASTRPEPTATGRPPSTAAYAPPAPSGEVPHDVLIVASKLKQYIRARSGIHS